MLLQLIEFEFILDELVEYLSSSSPLSILNLGATCWHTHYVITTSQTFRDFWAKLLHRMCHTSLKYVAIRDCYPDAFIYNHSWLMGVRHEIRESHGECQIEHHYRRRHKPCLFTTRDVYTEWRRIAGNRFLPSYWGHKQERKMQQLQYHLETLERKKNYFQKVNKNFGLLTNRLKHISSE